MGALDKDAARRLGNGQALRYAVKIGGRTVPLSALARRGDVDLGVLAGIEDNEVNRSDSTVFTDPAAAVHLATLCKHAMNTERVELYIYGGEWVPEDAAREAQHA